MPGKMKELSPSGRAPGVMAVVWNYLSPRVATEWFMNGSRSSSQRIPEPGSCSRRSWGESYAPGPDHFPGVEGRILSREGLYSDALPFFQNLACCLYPAQKVEFDIHENKVGPFAWGSQGRRDCLRPLLFLIRSAGLSRYFRRAMMPLQTRSWSLTMSIVFFMLHLGWSEVLPGSENPSVC